MLAAADHLQLYQRYLVDIKQRCGIGHTIGFQIIQFVSLFHGHIGGQQFTFRFHYRLTIHIPQAFSGIFVQPFPEGRQVFPFDG